MKEGAKTCKLEAQECLKHGKGRRNINETKQGKLEPKTEVTKTGCFGMGFWMVRFSQNI
jgi:hypothetical protein